MVASAVALLLCAGFVAVATAKVKRTPTEVSVFGAAGDTIGAQLTSSFKGCLRDRTVSFSDSSGDVFATRISDRSGALAIGIDEVPTAASTIRVEVGEAEFGSRVCEAATTELASDQPVLTGGPSGGAFQGALTSTVDGCEPGRLISLYEISSEPVFVGFNFTDAAGVWTIAQAGGTYEARADAAFVGEGAELTLCRAVTSPAWSFEDPAE
jgi:hypothetical protein